MGGLVSEKCRTVRGAGKPNGGNYQKKVGNRWLNEQYVFRSEGNRQESGRIEAGKK